MTYYVIIRGPLGVGKTTTATALARSIRATVVSIDEIADKNWDGGTLRMYLAANVKAAGRAREALRARTPVVFDGCFYWKGQLRDLERRLPLPHEVFTLEAPLALCIRRDSGRRQVHGPEATTEVFRKVTRFRYGITVDARRPLGEVVGHIRSLLPPEGQGLLES